MINLGIVLGLDATSTKERTTHGKKQRFHRHPKEFELLLVVFAAKLADTRSVVAVHGSEMSQPPPNLHNCQVQFKDTKDFPN
jgi:hypothetical protein